MSKPEMKGGQLLLAMVAVLSASGSNVAQEHTQTPGFSSSLDLISLHVTVTDQSRQCFERYPPYWNAGWDGIDLAEVRGFGIDGEVHQPFTTNHADLERAIRRVSPRTRESAESLLLELLNTFETAAMRAPTIRRDAIIFLTDGDASRGPGLNRALALARRSHVAIYAIALMGEQPLDETREPALSLRRLAAITGGRAFFPESGRRLSSLYTQIYEELSNQYTIGYVSTNPRRDGAWRNVTVSVKRPHSSARTKLGYLAPEP